MLKITKKGDYGLVMLTALARHPGRGFYPLKRIAADSNLPYKFISQIALVLKTAGILKSKEGLGGGYRLNLPPKKISIAKVLNILEGPVAPVACLRGKKCVNQSTCRHRLVMIKLAGVVNDTLKQHSLADLVKQPAQ